MNSPISGPYSQSSLSYRLAYPWATVALRGVLRALAPRWRVEGAANVPRRGGVILAPNHISDADPPFVGQSAPRPLWFMAKSELWEFEGARKYMGPMISWMQAFPVDPDSADREALRRAEDLLRARQALVVFPEGRIAHEEKLPLQPGVVMLALRSGVPIVPVGIWGTQGVVPYGSIWPRPTLLPVAVVFAPAIHFDDLAHLPRRAAREAATARLQIALEAATQRAKGLA
jgi:1-acyl-sn-glycerol-3-phosphate acyltransferase